MGVVSLDVVSVIGQSGGSQCECGQSGCGQWVWWSVDVGMVRVWVWSLGVAVISMWVWSQGVAVISRWVWSVDVGMVRVWVWSVDVGMVREWVWSGCGQSGSAFS